MIAHFGLPPQSHDAKSVVNVIETFPRDELFQTPAAELIPIVRGIVNLYERRRVRLFARRDSYERFYSCLVYVPRDRYNTEVRERIERIVRAALRRHARRNPGADLRSDARAPAPAGAHAAGRARRWKTSRAIEAEIAAAAATWEDRLQQALIARGVGTRRGGARRRVTRALFPPAYRADVEPAQALEDIADLEALAADPADAADSTCATHAGATARTALHLRILQVRRSDFDLRHPADARELRAARGRGTPLSRAGDERGVWIQDFELEARDAQARRRRRARAAVQGSLPRRLARRGGERRLQPAAAVRLA